MRDTAGAAQLSRRAALAFGTLTISPGFPAQPTLQQLLHLRQTLIQGKECPPVRRALLNPGDQLSACLRIVRFQMGSHEQLVGLDR